MKADKQAELDKVSTDKAKIIKLSDSWPLHSSIQLYSLKISKAFSGEDAARDLVAFELQVAKEMHLPEASDQRSAVSSANESVQLQRPEFGHLEQWAVILIPFFFSSHHSCVQLANCSLISGKHLLFDTSVQMRFSQLFLCTTIFEINNPCKMRFAFGNIFSANLRQAPARQAALGTGIPNTVVCAFYD
ncbi:Acetyl-CoA acetyltransferase, cytosolic 1 [Zea mays]|uniref:Acetyl-CoA acetyltransferase, cytosolic 1 n=1 Tax=Zea mays TaxID=4577 RepID=A0A3L6E2E1_MAIZE|nr:Acetyl-CoA acetyltransferase, cytosolic 1 [Zea mays]